MYDTKSRLFVMSVLSSNVDTSEIAPSASLRQTMLMKCKMADSMLSRFIVQAIRNRICSTIKKTIRTIAVRSEERPVGKGWVGTCRARWAQWHNKENKDKQRKNR